MFLRFPIEFDVADYVIDYSIYLFNIAVFNDDERNTRIFDPKSWHDS